ncbi:MAG: hypothetical protein IKO34_09315 [Bacteroidales bacterium]|nr:hypothetical protein [Bacteroidales bacterium]
MKRRIAFIVASLIISAFVFQSCQIHCSAFPEWLCKYAPYEEGSIVTFKNENDSVIKLKVENKYKTEKYSFRQNCKCACVCDLCVDLKSEGKEDFRMAIDCKLGVGRESLENTEKVAVFFQIGMGNGNMWDIAQKSFADINPNDYGNEQLGDTFSLQTKTDNKFSNMIVEKEKGLVEFYDKENNCTWRLME